MKIKKRTNHILKRIGIIIVGLMVLLSFGMYFFGVFDFFFSDIKPEENMTRSMAEEYLKSLKDKKDNSSKHLTEIAYYHYFLGEFEKAEEIIKRIVDNDPNEFNPYSLYSELLYLRGAYDEAEKIMIEQMESHPLDFNRQAKAQGRLMKIYYQTNQYNKVSGFSALKLFGMDGFIKWMSSFDKKPYQMVWNDNHITTISLISVEPLPIVEVKIQGKSAYMLIDTGGDATIIDKRFAKSLENSVGTIEGSFGGGKKSDLRLSKAKSMTIGELTIENVPVMILDISHFDNAITQEDIDTLDLPKNIQINGIIGTKLFQQVLGTLDYPNEQLILRDPKHFRSEDYIDSIKGNYEEFTFQLSELHTLTTKGTFIDKPVMYWLDSGFASEASLLIDHMTYNDLGIKPPKVSYDAEAISGGGKGYESGIIKDFGSAGIGKLIQKDVGIGYDPNMNMYWENEYIVEAMLSHSYLKHYSWTIDFREHKMYLVE